MDEAISTMSAITGATPQVARHFLNLTDGDAEQAIQLFFDSPDLSSGMAREPSPALATQTQPPQHRRSRDPPEIVNIDSDSDEDVPMDIDADMNDDFPESRDSDSHPSPPAALPTYGSYEDDEAVARRMQEELYAGGDMAGDYNTQGVRAPLTRTTETLVGPGSEWTPEDMHEAVLQQMRARQQPRSRMLSSHPKTPVLLLELC
jgi:UBX domain-containing protein 7